MRTRDLKAAARKAGRRAGESAATWAEIDETNASKVIAGFEDCDPAILDSFRYPDLSGEFSGDPTPRSLMDDLGLSEDDSRYEWLESDLCDEWTDAAGRAFERELCRRCRYYLSA